MKLIQSCHRNKLATISDICCSFVPHVWDYYLGLLYRYSWNKASRIFLALLISLSCASMLQGQQIKPKLTLIASGAVIDLVIDGNTLYTATDQGKIDVFDITSGSRINQIEVPSIHDFMGDEIPSKIYSIDRTGDKLIMVVQGNHGFRNVLVFENGDLHKIIDADKDKLMIKKARFIDSNRIIYCSLSNEITLYNIQLRQEVYKIPISAYSFSDFCLNETRSEIYTCDESGIIHRINVNNGELLFDYSGNNVDNVYQVVFNNGILITGGPDRRVGIYNTVIDDNYYVEGDFLIYSVGLSPDGSIGAFSASEDNEVSLINTYTKEIFQMLKGHNSTITKIVFINNSTLITACDDPNIFIWEITGE